MRIALIALAVLLALPIAPTAMPVAAKSRARTVTRTVRNPASITIPIAESYPASATRYPSPVVVKGMKGKIRDVNLRLRDVSHDDPQELQLLLVGPGGQTAIVVADVGGEEPVTGVTLRLDDEAVAPLTDATLHSGTYRPTNGRGSAIGFNPPAPAPNANAALSVFDGTKPTGTWRLFVQDDNRPSEAGIVAGGWELEITAQVTAKKRKR